MNRLSNLRTIIGSTSVAVTLLASVAAFGQTSPGADFVGTTWQLVRFQGGDERVLTPDDRTKYTLEFQTDGGLNARIDCNRGRGTWKSSGPSQLQFGPLALTRALCPPGSMHDQIVKQWSFIRSYVMRDGHLFLALMADGGIFEFEPVTATKPSGSKSPVASTGPFAYECASEKGGTDILTATFTRPSRPWSLSSVKGRHDPRSRLWPPAVRNTKGRT
jgi:heat shock protein HslJ